MKPIHLSFSGLHSYRDTQHVDFTELCEGGLFGIFGPTGSGKSTVLDAITLALYAQVDRAPGGRQGIMNDTMDDLAVSFTFEIGNDNDRQRYRVERRYKRSGPQNMRIAHARLTRGDDPEPTVLADKDGDVTTAIRHIIGLKFADFTRAVVLPQGKFAEFIRMTGSDRGKMLERLFGLEQFGEQLAAKVRKQLGRAETELGKITSEQSGLGDASAKRVAELSQLVSRASAVVAAADGLRQQATKHLRQAETQRTNQAALEKTREQLQPLLAAAHDMEQNKRVLNLANAAEPVRSLIENMDKLQDELGQAHAAALRVSADWEKARAHAARAETVMTRAKTSRQEQEPDLAKRRNALETAVEDDKQLRELQARLASLEADDSDLKNKKQLLQRQHEEQTAVLQALTARRQQLLDEQEAFTVSPAHRRRIADAAAALERFNDTEKTVAAAHTELEQYARSLKSAESVYKQHENTVRHNEQRLKLRLAELDKVQTAPPTDGDTLTADARFIENAQNVLEQLQSLYGEHDAAEALLAEAKRHEEKAQQRYNEAVAKQYALQQRLAAAQDMLEAAKEAAAGNEYAHEAAALAATLRPDSPCPVCGSLHHPQPAAAADRSLEQRRLAETEANEMKDRHAAAGHEAALAETNLRHAQTNVHDKRDSVATVARRITGVRARLNAQWQHMDLAELEQAVQSETEAAEKRQQQARQWQQSVQQLQEECDEARQATDIAQKEAAGAGRDLAAAQAQHQTAGTRLTQVQQQYDEALHRFKEAAHDMTPEAIRDETELIRANDEKAEHLRAEIKNVTDRLPTAEKQAAATESAANDTVIAINKLANEISLTQKEADRLEAKIHNVTGGNNATDMLAQIVRALEQLAENETAAYKQYETTRTAAATIEQQSAVAADRVDRLTTETAETKQRLAARVTDAGFATADEAREALLSHAERKRLADEIADHRAELHRLTTRQAELEAELGDNFVTDQMWQAMTLQAEAVETAYQGARDAAVAAQTIYEDTKDKHPRWTELARQRHDLERIKQRLDQLNGLLRGNRFVDFVAEEYLTDVVHAASVHLGALTRQRYALELDTDGSFVIRDDSNGGMRRPVSSLSGGETFITSLALALALSHQIQLHGQYPLEFFFLDEGFGTLDSELLETVIVSLEKLQNEQVSIGLISHVPELRPRVARRLVVTPAEAGTEGSRLVFERG